MSQRTFCDSCGGECLPPRRSVFHLTEYHYAEADPRNPVAEDSYEPADLCNDCTTRVRRALGIALRMISHYPMGDDAARMGDEDTRLVRVTAPYPPDVPHG